MNARRHATTFVLVGLCLGAAGFLYATRDSVTTGEQHERRSNLLTVFRRDALSRVLVERDGERYELVRDAQRKDAGEIDTWKIQLDKGRTETADESLVDALLSSLELAFPERRIRAAEVDRARFGLVTPRLRLSLGMGKTTTTLSVGGPAPKPEGSVYAEVDGEVVVVKIARLAPMDKPATAYTSRRLSPYLSTDLATLTLTEGGQARVLSRQKDGKFRLDGRLLDRFGWDKALAAFADLTLTDSLSVEVAEKAQAGSALVRVRLDPVELPSEKRASVTLVLGGVCPTKGREDEVAAVRQGPEPSAGCVARAAAEALGKGIETELRAFTFREDEVEEISLVRGDARVEIVRKDKGFHQRLPEDRDLSLDEARAFVKALVSAKAESLAAEHAEMPELRAPVGEVRVTGVPLPGAEPGGEKIIIGAVRKDGFFPVKREADGAILLFSREAAAAFLPRATSLRPHRILDRKPDEARRVTVVGESDSGPLDQALSREGDGSWSLEKPKGLPLDAGLAQDLAEGLARLTAERWHADRDEGGTGLDKPTLIVTVSFAAAPAGTGSPAAATTERIVFGSLVPGGILARRDGDPAVFVVGKALLATLTSLALDRQVFQIDDTDAAKVTLETKAGTRVFAFENGALVAKGGTAPPRDGERVREGLAGLRAEGAVHAGPEGKAEGFAKPQLTVAVEGKPGKPNVRFRIGAADVYRGTAVYYARKDGLAATFVIPSARLRPLLDE